MAEPSFDPLLATIGWSPPLIASWTTLLCWFLAGILLAPLLFVVAGVLLVIICVFLVPRPVGKVIGWAAVGLFYRIRLHHPERLPATGGAVLVLNHISWIDGILLMMMTPRLVRTMVYAGNFQSKIMQVSARRWEAIMVSPGPKSILRALKTAREGVQKGEVIGIFPEGGISRNGTTQAFKPGFLKIVEGTDAAVIPIYFDGLWGSIFSFERRKFFWKIPRRWRYPIDIYFGEPMYQVRDVHEVRQAMLQLGATAVKERIDRKTDLPEAVIRACKRRKIRIENRRLGRHRLDRRQCPDAGPDPTAVVATTRPSTGRTECGSPAASQYRLGAHQFGIGVRSTDCD